MAVFEAFIQDPLISRRLKEVDTETTNGSALISRVLEKLSGTDFTPDQELDISEQVDLLVWRSISNVNLCQSYIGW